MRALCQTLSYWCNNHGKDGIFGGMGMNGSLGGPFKRRDFLGMAALSTFFVSFGAALLGMLRLIKPNVYPEPSRRYKIGEPGAFPLGEVKTPQGKSVFIFHGESGFYAISAVCTHLGCIVNLGSKGFECPCHGSRFDTYGRVISGAAAKGLDWYLIEMAPDGQLIVDEGKRVKVKTYFSV